jgi:septal ring factor EnvC (AmiA/AmiB activator)
MTENRTAEWHLDRRVTVALIVALILNAVATALLVPGLDSRVGENEKDIARNTRFIEQDRRELSGVASSLASMNATLAALVSEVSRLANRLDNHNSPNEPRR